MQTSKLFLILLLFFSCCSRKEKIIFPNNIDDQIIQAKKVSKTDPQYCLLVYIPNNCSLCVSKLITLNRRYSHDYDIVCVVNNNYKEKIDYEISKFDYHGTVVYDNDFEFYKSNSEIADNYELFVLNSNREILVKHSGLLTNRILRQIEKINIESTKKSLFPSKSRLSEE